MPFFLDCTIDYNVENAIKRQMWKLVGSFDVHVGRISLGTEQFLEETRAENDSVCITSRMTSPVFRNCEWAAPLAASAACVRQFERARGSRLQSGNKNRPDCKRLHSDLRARVISRLIKQAMGRCSYRVRRTWPERASSSSAPLGNPRSRGGWRWTASHPTIALVEAGLGGCRQNKGKK